MEFHNTTDLDSTELQRLFERHTLPYRHDRLVVRVRYSRGADFSGACYYTEGRIFINLGRHVQYPYRLSTHIAKSQSNATHWWRETFRLTLRDATQLALFVYMHELYHYLVKVAHRNPRRKEAMCDRFAARTLVDAFGCRVTDALGRNVDRARWDFQDVDGFVAAAPKVPMTLWDLPTFTPPNPSREIPVTIRGTMSGTRRPRV